MEDDIRLALDALERAREAKMAELRALDKAIHELCSISNSGRIRDYAGLGIVEASKRWIREQGRPCSTREIADAIRSRGVETRAKNWVATVYATLDNCKYKEVLRSSEGKWTLVN